MKVSELEQEVRNRIDDKDGIGEFTDNELISYIKQAMNYIGAYFVTAGNPIALKELIVTDNSTLPNDFIKTAGTFPLKITGKNVKLLAGYSSGIKIKYFFQPENITASSTIMPYTDNATLNVILQLSVIFAQNQQKHYVTQDKAITAEIMTIINTAYGYTN